MEDNEAMLCAYIEGDLDAAGRAQIEKLLQDNPQHRKLLAELTAMRDLVRGLPRVKAPMDLGDSLRQRAERSMLLDGPGAVVPQRERMSRWPQFFAIAAIFLLFASLCFILYKALGPTLKPAEFTQNMEENKILNNIEPTSESSAPVMNAPAAPAGAAPSAFAGAPQAAAHQAEAKTQLADATIQKVQNLQDQLQRQVVAASQPDLAAIRRRLESSGYGVTASDGRMGGGNSPPVLMVVNSTDAPATKVQIAQFLNNSTGISWSVIPQEADWKSKATTPPSGEAIGGGAGEGQLKPAVNSLDFSSNGAGETDNATTRPSTDVFYVARGLTAEQADALRQTLIVPQNGPEVQVTMQSAQPLATTEPSTQTDKDVNSLGAPMILAAATSQTSLSADAENRVTSPTTAPAEASLSYGLRANAGLSANQRQALQSVDAVIVLEQSGTPVLTAGPSTQADSVATKSELAPATRPSTQP
jgi:anti-sigma factor RsiW